MQFDIIISGGGISGMLLAYFLSQSTYKKKRILILEKNLSDRPNRELSFWIDHEHPFEAIVSHRWSRLAGNFRAGTVEKKLEKYQFQLLQSNAFFSYVDQIISENKQIVVQEETVIEEIECDSSVQVRTLSNSYSAKWVFSSIIPASRTTSAQVMTGLSWRLNTKSSVLDPSTLFFCDFRHQVNSLPGFFHILPLSDTEALLYYAAFTTSAQNHRAHVINSVPEFLGKSLGNSAYSYTEIGEGRYPVRGAHRKRARRSRIVPIGAAAGMIKTSTSYGFTNILHDCQRIAENLEAYNHPYYARKNRWIHHLADTAMSHMIHSRPQMMESLLFSLFHSELTGDEILAFLDEKSSWQNTKKVFSSVHPKVFVSSSSKDID